MMAEVWERRDQPPPSVHDGIVYGRGDGVIQPWRIEGVASVRIEGVSRHVCFVQLETLDGPLLLEFRSKMGGIRVVGVPL